VRAHAEPVPCTAAYDGGRISARLHAPVRGVAAGQELVLYDGPRVLAAGRIVSAAA
jgi:tRNA-uridine 2-sulfurtransferase